MLNFNFQNPRIANPGDFRQPVGTGGVRNPNPQPVSGPVAGPTNAGPSNFAPSGGFFTPSVPDDIGAELDRFRQARNRFGVGQPTP